MKGMDAKTGGRALFVLGGNASTLAFVTSLRADEPNVRAHLVPLAQTPLGIAAGDERQSVTIPYESLAEWIDKTFPAQDEDSFVVPMRDVELLLRINWHSEAPEKIEESDVINADDLPPDVAEALEHPAEQLVACAVCRRLCVRGHFTWNDRELCAWDYHRQVFGKRGPWRSQEYDDRHFETLPAPAYVAAPLLEEAGAQVVLAVTGVDAAIAREAVNLLIRSEPRAAYMCIALPQGHTLLRER